MNTDLTEKLEQLEANLRTDSYEDDNYVMKLLKEAQNLAINFTHCCTEVCECKKHSIKTSYGFEICTKCGNEWDV
jgi:hypothetical protein